MTRKLSVIISLDVEEEGLFSGKYPRVNPGVQNVACIETLESMSRDLGFPLTLFCAHSVFVNAKALKSVALLRDKAGAEVGAHLHHWSTPPLTDEKCEPPQRTHELQRELLERKLVTLLEAGAKFQGAPLTSFRMGRWDLKAELLPILVRNGIQVDSSVCPLRHFGSGPDHFLAPPQPYWCELPDGSRLFEEPITQLPLARGMARIWYGVTRNVPAICDYFHFFGCVSANPFWHSLRMMKLATRLLVRQGGGVLNFFWHSSEMMPGGSPHTPTPDAAGALLDKMKNFCLWLRANYEVEGLTASQLPKRDGTFPVFAMKPGRDW